MIIRLILIFFCIGLSLFFALCLSPIVFIFDSRNRERHFALLSVNFINPHILKFSYSFITKKYRIILFNKFNLGSSKQQIDDENKSDDNSNNKETDINVQNRGKDSYDKSSQVDLQSESLNEHQPIEKDASYKKATQEKKDQIHKRSEEKDSTIKKTKGEKRFFKRVQAKIENLKIIIKFSIGQKKFAEKIIRWLGKTISKLLKLAKFNRLSLYIKAGFSDPALTGALHGFFTGIFHGFEIEQNRYLNLEFEPVFDNKDVFEFESGIIIKTSVARILIPLLTALFSFPYISAYLFWRQFKKLKAGLEMQ